jgi:hypothetical protein
MRRPETKTTSVDIALLEAMTLSDSSSSIPQSTKVRYAKLVQGAFAKMKTMNIEEQNHFLELIEKDIQWAERFTLTRDKLNDMAQTALLEYAQGKTTEQWVS